MNASLLRLSLATLLFALAGVIVRAAPVDVFFIVEARASLAALALLAWAFFLRIPLSIGRELYGRYLLLGLLLATHWCAFFRSIQLTSVAVGLLTYSCYPMFNLLAAAASNRRLPDTKETMRLSMLLCGLAVLLLPQWQARDLNLLGVGMGLLSGLLFSLIQFLNHKLVRTENPVKISLYQNGVAALALLPWVPLYAAPTEPEALLAIFVLGLLCTATAHTVFIAGMRGVANRTVSLFAYLEPVCGIALAALLLREIPPAITLVGGAVILSSFAFDKQGLLEKQS